MQRFCDRRDYKYKSEQKNVSVAGIKKKNSKRGVAVIRLLQ